MMKHKKCWWPSKDQAARECMEEARTLAKRFYKEFLPILRSLKADFDYVKVFDGRGAEYDMIRYYEAMEQRVTLLRKALAPRGGLWGTEINDE